MQELVSSSCQRQRVFETWKSLVAPIDSQIAAMSDRIERMKMSTDFGADYRTKLAEPAESPDGTSCRTYCRKGRQRRHDVGALLQAPLALACVSE